MPALVIHSDFGKTLILSFHCLAVLPSSFKFLLYQKSKTKKTNVGQDYLGNPFLFHNKGHSVFPPLRGVTRYLQPLLHSCLFFSNSRCKSLLLISSFTTFFHHLVFLLFTVRFIAIAEFFVAHFLSQTKPIFNCSKILSLVQH